MASEQPIREGKPDDDGHTFLDGERKDLPCRFLPQDIVDELQGCKPRLLQAKQSLLDGLDADPKIADFALGF